MYRQLLKIDPSLQAHMKKNRRTGEMIFKNNDPWLNFFEVDPSQLVETYTEEEAPYIKELMKNPNPPNVKHYMMFFSEKVMPKKDYHADKKGFVAFEGVFHSWWWLERGDPEEPEPEWPQ